MAKSKIKTVVRVQDNSAKYLDKVTTGVEGLLKRSAFRIARRAVESMKHDSTSKVVKNRDDRGKFLKQTTRKLKQGESNPSKPGDPPGVLTGMLRASIDVEFFRDGTETLVARVGSNLEYARALELGAPGRNLLPRPFLRPAFHAEGFSASGYTDPFASRLKKVLEKAGR